MLPECEVVVSTGMEFVVEWDTGYPVKHEIRQLRALSVSLGEHEGVDTHCQVYQVDEGPANLLRHARDGIDDDLARKDEDNMD